MPDRIAGLADRPGDYCASGERAGREQRVRRLRYHGDQAAAPGCSTSPSMSGTGSRRPGCAATGRPAARPGALPRAADHDAALTAVARRHGVAEDQVLLLAGGSEGFALLPALRPRRAALIAPSFTEPEAVLAAAGVPLGMWCSRRRSGSPRWRYRSAPTWLSWATPPTRPGSCTPRESVLALRRPGRLVVVDEAFADAVPDEPQSLAALDLPDVVVLRSLTKTWSLAGLRVGYALGAPEVLARLAARRPHWPLGTLQLEAIAACCAPAAVAEALAGARRCRAAGGDGGGTVSAGPRRGRRQRAVRPVRRPGCRPDA